MIFFRLLSNPSWLNGGFDINFWDKISAIKPGQKISGVFATPHLSAIKAMADEANQCAFEQSGGMAFIYVIVIDAKKWDTDTKKYPKKCNHYPATDDDEVVVLDGTVREVLEYSNDRWKIHDLTFIEKYGLDVVQDPDAIKCIKNLVAFGSK
ncbi:hypothetical protein [Thermoanaerobacterium thermosaccharolyticum]|uniref:hypothetical protein n=1 Tax=Thermoanaerobacterium thermosaccharolyticum TaxID=1517 RepID=UPI003DA8D209